MRKLDAGFELVRMRRYPHMMQMDREVWEMFLSRPLPGIERVWYDVHVGMAMAAAEPASEAMRLVANAVSRKRIDVVMRIRGRAWVVEIKPYGNHVALGQVLLYRRLFRKEFAGAGNAGAIVLCHTADGDAREEFGYQGVRVVEVGDGG